MASPRDILRALTPPFLWMIAQKLKSYFFPVFEGPFASWQAAEAAAIGWDSPVVTNTFLGAAIKVRDGVAEFERDGAVGDKIIYSPTILAFLILVLARQSKTLNIIDLGGSLGSNYFQNRKIIRQLSAASVNWHVVERPLIAKLGTEQFQTNQLDFYPSLADVLSVEAPVPDALLFSGSLQCLADPFATLAQAIDAGIRIIAIDRNFISPASVHKVFVMHVAKNVSVPVTCFSKDKLISWFLDKEFILVEHFTQTPEADVDICGMIFIKQ